MILIVSSQQDDHAVAVMRRLDQRGAPYLLLDTSAFPTKLQLSVEYLRGERSVSLRDISRGTDIDLSTVRTAWYRRPQPLVLHSGIVDPATSEFTFNECVEAVSGLWQIIDAHWINHPVYDAAAARKLAQLKVAAEAGLTVPRTLVTNRPAEAERFFRSTPGGKFIYKSFQNTGQAWRETRLLTAEAVKKLDDVQYAPVIFQEYIPARCDLRVTIIGEQLFAIAVYTDPQHYAFDYRMNLETVRAETFELPRSLETALLRLMRRLNLVYGAIDMRYTPDGDYYFLEINPAGQWQFLEEKTDLRITDYFAHFLMRSSVQTPANPPIAT